MAELTPTERAKAEQVRATTVAYAILMRERHPDLDIRRKADNIIRMALEDPLESWWAAIVHARETGQADLVPRPINQPLN